MMEHYGTASGLCRNGHTSVGGCFTEKTLDQGYGRIFIKGQIMAYEGYIDTKIIDGKKDMYLNYKDENGVLKTFEHLENFGNFASGSIKIPSVK